MTGYLEENTKYVVEKKIDNKGTKIILQSVDDAKQICQNWNDIKCEDCDTFADCELK